jgi:hypothetical protein
MEGIVLPAVITYIQSTKIGDLIYRQDLIKLNGRWTGASTADNYRNYLTHAGYLRTKYSGAYEYMKKIPKNMSYAQLVKEAYPESEWTQKYKII